MTKQTDTKAQISNNNRLYNGTSKAERQAVRREQLITSGIAVIGTTGYQATKVKQVCQHAGLTERYFYESFSNKEALLCAGYQQILQSFQSEMQQIVTQGIKQNNLEPLTLAKKGLRTFFEIIQADPAAARLILLEILSVSDAVDAVYRKAMADFDAILILAAGPYFQVDESNWSREVLARSLTGAATQTALQWILNQYDQPLEVMVESCFVLFKAIIEYFQRQALESQ